MGVVVVFDSDVLIGFLNRDDAHHESAVERVRASLTPGMRRLLCAVNHAEIMVGPIRTGAQERVTQMLAQLNIETVAVDAALAVHAAAVRAQTNVKLPDAFALATAVAAERGSANDVSLATFDQAVLKAYATFHRGRGNAR
jgi:predicted nucleic acid-binding protein